MSMCGFPPLILSCSLTSRRFRHVLVLGAYAF